MDVINGMKSKPGVPMFMYLVRLLACALALALAHVPLPRLSITPTTPLHRNAMRS